MQLRQVHQFLVARWYEVFWRDNFARGYRPFVYYPMKFINIGPIWETLCFEWMDGFEDVVFLS